MTEMGVQGNEKPKEETLWGSLENGKTWPRKIEPPPIVERRCRCWGDLRTRKKRVIAYLWCVRRWGWYRWRTRHGHG